MSAEYSQTKGMLAIAKASLRAIFRSPSAVVFSLVFPLIFILVFGFIGGGRGLNIRIAFDANSDTLNPIYKQLTNTPGIRVIRNDDPIHTEEELGKGRLIAILNIKKNIDSGAFYVINLKSSDAVSQQDLGILQSLLQGMTSRIDHQMNKDFRSIATVSPEVVRTEGRTYRTIDFILPGQLGFSLLSAGVFGVAFIFYNLRQTLVLKRFFATPIKRSHILFGEAISRVLFQIITAVIILGVGHLAFNFTLVNGFLTFIELIILSLLGLVVFMGFGFVVSGLAKSESAIPPFANLITLPQFLLAGTFFPTDNFPKWLQPICDVLPLTHLNDAMRSVAFEGLHIQDCMKQIGILAIWGVIVYILAVKFFRWE